jgi:peptidoglycan hydrolase-like protein with peptidoglycan-binding domain
MVTLPITPLVRPGSLQGVENGKLPSRLLAEIGVPGALMELTAARASRAMLAEMRKGGFEPRQVGHYRTFQQQLNLFLSRYQEASFETFQATPGAHRKQWNEATRNGYRSIYWVKKLVNGRYPATAATPGNSNHGWGLALDLAEEYDADSAPDPIRAQWVNWLVQNAHRYGVSAELQSEPWHWRYVAGDNIPKAVLDYEAGVGNSHIVTPAHEPTPVLVFAYPGRPVVRGSQGDAVKLVQAKVGATVDGDFGAATERRVRDWQARNGMKVDGVVGPVTWKRMFG